MDPSPRIALLGLLFAAVVAVPATAQEAPDLLVETPSPSFFRRVADGSTGLFRRDTGILLGSGGVVAWGLTLRENPRQISRQLDGSMLEGGIDFADLYGDGRTIAAAGAGLLLIGALGPDSYGHAGRDLLASLAVSSAAVWTLKLGVGRRRPLGGPHSFPSGHTAAAFSTLPVIAHHAGPWAGLVATAIAVGTGAARMEDQRHYASDVVFGAALGYAVGAAVAGQSVPWSQVWEKLTLSGKGVGVRLRF